MRAPEFKPGFRLSILDVAVIALGSAGAIIFGAMNWQIGFVIGFVICHFFLFCNVLRATRASELMWSGVFVALAGGTITWDVPGWIATVAVSGCFTVLVALLEMRRPSYHGVGWRRINPELGEWWRRHVRDVYKMRIVRYRQTEFPWQWKWRKKSPLYQFLLEIPYALYLSHYPSRAAWVVPSREALNEVLREGSAGGGMGTGFLWESFEMSSPEYQEVLDAWKNCDLRYVLRGWKSFTGDLEIIFDEQIMALPNYEEYCGRCVEKDKFGLFKPDQQGVAADADKLSDYAQRVPPRTSIGGAMDPSLRRQVMYFLSAPGTWGAFAILLFALLGAVLAIGGAFVYGSELKALVESGAYEGVMVVGIGFLAFAMFFPWAYIIFLAHDLEDLRKLVGESDLARLEYVRMFWQRPEMRSLLLAHWTDPRHPCRERFLRHREWIERLLEAKYFDSALEEELLAHGMSLSDLIREIPPVFGAFWQDSSHAEAEDEDSESV